MTHSRLPIDHPVLQWKPTRQELKELRRQCVWMKIECNAWSWTISGPSCGLDSMNKLSRCKRRRQYAAKKKEQPSR